MKRWPLTLCLALLVSCSRAGVHEATNTRLVIAQTWSPANLNSIYNDGFMSGMLNATLYSYLTNYDPQGNLVPEAATQVPSVANGGISKDGLRITFHLRHDIQWADDVPLTAKDVVFTFGQIMNPNNSISSRYGYDDVSKVRAIDPYTVQFTMHRANAPAVSALFGFDANCAILPEHLLSHYSSLNAIPFDSAPVGSGPYVVKQWLRGDSLLLAANDRYFRGKPHVQTIDVKFVHDQSTVMNQLRTGEVNAAFSVGPKTAAELRNLPGHRVVRTLITGIEDVIFNVTAPIVDNVDVRRAIAFGIDRNEINKAFFDNQFDADDGMRGLFSWAYNANVSRVAYDPVRAGALLDRAGWRRGADGIRYKDGRPLELSFAVVHPDEGVATNIAAQLRKLGIRIDMRTVSIELADTPAGPILGGSFQLAFFPLASGVDPNVSWLFSCNQRAPHGFNLMRYCNPQVDELLRNSIEVTERRARARYLVQVQRIVNRDMPILALAQSASLDVIPDDLQGFSPTPGLEPYNDVYTWRLARSAFQ